MCCSHFSMATKRAQFKKQGDYKRSSVKTICLLNYKITELLINVSPIQNLSRLHALLVRLCWQPMTRTMSTRAITKLTMRCYVCKQVHSCATKIVFDSMVTSITSKLLPRCAPSGANYLTLATTHCGLPNAPTSTSLSTKHICPISQFPLLIRTKLRTCRTSHGKVQKNGGVKTSAPNK